MSVKTVVRPQQSKVQKPEPYRYAPYWENDDTMNPVLVRYIGQDKDGFYLVKLPDGAEKWVHLHHLGVWH